MRSFSGGASPRTVPPPEKTVSLRSTIFRPPHKGEVGNYAGLSEWAALLDQRALHLVLQLLEGAYLDLAHALAADPVFLRQLLERRGVVLQAPRLDDLALALGELAQGAR